MQPLLKQQTLKKLGKHLEGGKRCLEFVACHADEFIFASRIPLLFGIILSNSREANNMFPSVSDSRDRDRDLYAASIFALTYRLNMLHTISCLKVTHHLLPFLLFFSRHE